MIFFSGRLAVLHVCGCECECCCCRCVGRLTCLPAFKSPRSICVYGCFVQKLYKKNKFIAFSFCLLKSVGQQCCWHFANMCLQNDAHNTDLANLLAQLKCAFTVEELRKLHREHVGPIKFLRQRAWRFSLCRSQTLPQEILLQNLRDSWTQKQRRGEEEARQKTTNQVGGISSTFEVASQRS